MSLWDHAEDAVKETMIAPSTTSFPSVWSGGDYRFRKSGCDYDLYGPVDLQNGFGAMLRAQWHVHASHKSKDEYQVEVDYVVAK